MATGDVEDFVGRLKAVLPGGWFPAESKLSGVLTPTLTAVLSGPAWSLSWLYNLIAYAKEQTRIATATDVWLDIIALDYFGLAGLVRRVNESDAAYSARIRAALFAPKATRAAVIEAVQELVGTTPIIFEPANTGDTGGWSGVGVPTWEGLAYNQAGGYGDLQLPFQFFIIVILPATGGIASVGGYYYGLGWAGGGYGTGALEYGELSYVGDQVTTQDIYSTIDKTIPAGVVAWTAITSLAQAEVEGLITIDINGTIQRPFS